jgi:hypothetical protein
LNAWDALTVKGKKRQWLINTYCQRLRPESTGLFLRKTYIKAPDLPHRFISALKLNLLFQSAKPSFRSISNYLPLASLKLSATPLHARSMSSNSLKIVPRFSTDRGNADHGWLKTFHTFSFASYVPAPFHLRTPANYVTSFDQGIKAADTKSLALFASLMRIV